jgi:hypothetical protein
MGLSYIASAQVRLLDVPKFLLAVFSSNCFGMPLVLV